MLRVTKKVFRILDARQKKMAVILGFMMLMGAVMESMSVSLILPLISAITDAEAYRSKWYGELICNIFGAESHQQYIIVLLALLIIIFILKNMYLLFEYYLQYTFIAKCQFKMKSSLMVRFMNKPYSYYLNASSGEIIRIVNNDTQQAFLLLTNALTFYTEIIVAAVLGLTILIMSPCIAIELIITLCFELLIIAKIVKPVMRRIGIRSRADGAEANKWILQATQGIKSVKVSGVENFFTEKFSYHVDRMVDADRKYQTLGTLPRLLIEAFTVVSVLGMIIIMISTGTEVVVIVPQLSAFVVAMVRLLPSVNRVSAAINVIPFYEGGLDNVIETLELEYNGKYNSNQYIVETKSKKSTNVEILKFNKSIEINELYFSYPGSDKIILNGINLTVKKGQSVGIVGTSGGGKTTSVDLLLGLLTPRRGKVLIDGVDIKSNISGWLNHVAYIPQQIFLIDGTIRENVVFGLMDEDENRVWDALREAQMDAFVKELPKGIDTEVGEQGIRLSGGQRQRIGIARALYGQPDVIVFDEATSALDNDTEAAIMESVDNLMGKITLFIIAHRLTTIEHCDHVFRVENGKMIKER